MRLDDVESQEAMLAALAGGDEELERDIDRALRNEISNLDHSNSTTEWEMGMEAEHYAAMVDGWAEGDLTSVVESLAGRWSEQVDAVLAAVPAETQATAIREEILEAAEEPAHAGNTRHGSSSVFEFNSGRGPGIDLRAVQVETQIYLEEPLSWVPAERVVKGLAYYGWDYPWEEFDEGRYSTGWQDGGDYWRLEARNGSESILEWAHDLRGRYFSDLVDAEPKVAVKAFLAVLAADYPDLSKRVKKAKLPADVLADYAVAYFSDPEEGIEIISEATGVFGYEGSQAEVVLEIDKPALRELGITEGRWWDGAPWKLLNLPPAELAYEGTLMRHCVGSFNMGYREAVARGETMIWSLRSRFNKPILTFEIDRHAWEAGADMGGPAGSQRRSAAIQQLTGKLNRAPAGDWQEARVLHRILTRLGADPGLVHPSLGGDLRDVREENPGFNQPWRPYGHRARGRLMRWR